MTCVLAPGQDVAGQTGCLETTARQPNEQQARTCGSGSVPTERRLDEDGSLGGTMRKGGWPPA